MNLIPDILSEQAILTAWRRDLHAHPELAFNETRTADFVAAQLAECGIDVTRGVGRTGVVGTLTTDSGGKSVGLRADMDALPMEELNNFAHKSVYPGRMHGCGHDGHTTMLLAAARYLAQTRQFEGTVHFIFQPAEEANDTGSGAQAMIDDGLFDRFPMESIFGMHNWPPLPVGTFAVCPGPVMAAMHLFEVTITGKGTHGALPHTGVDPILAAGHMLTAWQSIVSRNVDAQQTAVISATSIQGGENSWNVIPQTVRIRGTARAFTSDIGELIKDRFTTITEYTAQALGVKTDIHWEQRTPATNNDPEMAAMAQKVAIDVVGTDQVLPPQEAPRQTGSEDFACFLQHKPGAYIWLGNGNAAGGEANETSQGSVCMIHEPRYDFNDAILPVGASFWVRLVERLLA